MDIDDFVKAIIEDPHDIASRLVFADFLEEIGDPRSEMIRLQFQLADVSKHDPARRALRARELKLSTEHGCFGTIPPFAKFLGAEGGFVDAIEITVARFLKYQDEIFSQSPIRKVVMTGKSKRFVKLAESPHLQKLRSITLKNNNESDQVLRHFLSSDGLSRLESLDIRGEWVSQTVVETIANAPALADLRTLHLHSYQDISIEPIAKSSTMTGLEDLLISGASDADCMLVSAHSNFRQLRKIEVGGHNVSENGMRLLHASRIYPDLESLVLDNGRYSYLREETSHASPFDVETGVGRLKHLEVVGGFGSEIMTGILANFKELEVLRLSENRIDDRGAIALAQSDLFARLKKLYLTNNQLTREGAVAIGEAKKRNKSIKLYLDGNAINRPEAGLLRQAYGKSFLSPHQRG